MENEKTAESKPEDYRRDLYSSYVDLSTAGRLVEEKLYRSREPFLKHLIKKHIIRREDLRILDVACGNGALLHYLTKSGFKHVYGVDGSKQQVELAQKLGNANVDNSDLFVYLQKIKNESFDIVIGFDVIEHFTKNECLRFVKELYRILSPNGKAIIHTGNGESPFGARIRYNDLTHELIFTRESMTQLLKFAKFERICFFEDKPIVHGLKSFVRLPIWEVFRTMLRIYISAETGNASREVIFTQNFLVTARKR